MLTSFKGIAYAGSQTPSNASSISNITCEFQGPFCIVMTLTIPVSTADSKSGTWMVTTDAGDTFNWGVANSGNTLETVGVANASSSMNTTGFGLYGAWAYRLSDAGEIEMNYRAVPTGVDDLYIIKWAPSATVDDSALLINLRTASPVPITDKNKNKQ